MMARMAGLCYRLRLPPTGFATASSCRSWLSPAVLRRAMSSETQLPRLPVRNVGVFAHVDAGKTTTTERILYYAGVIGRIGEVDDGNTTMDYMDQERERGITINAAAITFNWQDTCVNLIDTPGHVDFTSEVERTARVLDGAVVVLDAVAGVEAQTETVWQQAQRHGVSRIAFVNKLDRVGASMSHTLRTMRQRLGVVPLAIQFPVEEGPEFTSLVDVVTMEVVVFEGEDEMFRTELDEAVHGPALCARAAERREALVESLAELDEELGDLYLLAEDGQAAGAQLAAHDVHAALHRVTLDADGTGVVVLCGAAYKNKGVQPLLDAVVRYLPSPDQVPPVVAEQRPHGCTNEDAATGVPVPCDATADGALALVFKMQKHSHRGVLAFLRVYGGSLRTGDAVINSRHNRKEKVARLVRVQGDGYEDVEVLEAGHIGAVIGLRMVETGDSLCTQLPALGQLSRQQQKNRPALALHLPGVTLAPPVFTVGVEASSVTEQAALDEALTVITLEDPSVHVFHDESLGQTLISGMGELHLEVVKERLKTDFRVKAHFGQMRVSYRETVRQQGEGNASHDVTVGAKKQWARVGVTVRPLTEADTGAAATAEPDKKKEGAAAMVASSDHPRTLGAPVLATSATTGETKQLPAELAEAVWEGVDIGLRRGVLLGCPLQGVAVELETKDIEWHESNSTPAAFRAAACMAVKNALAHAAPMIMEPVMSFEARVPPDFVGDVLSDLTSKRRGTVQEVNNLEGFAGRTYVDVSAQVPLPTMIGYSTCIRTVTKGEGNFSMAFAEYQPVGEGEQRRLLASGLQ